MPDTPSLRLDLAIQGCNFRCAIGTPAGNHVIETTGNCVDTLGEFVRAGLMIATGAWDTVRIRFDDEPVETRITLAGFWDAETWCTRLSLRVLSFKDLFDRSPDKDGELLFEAICDPQEFSEEVYRNAQLVWDGLGPDKRWGGVYPFPRRALDALTAALATADVPPYVDESRPVSGGWTIFEAPNPG